MSPSIVSFGQRGFNEFSVLLHETIERYSSKGEEPKEFSFYIPPDSLEALYNKEKRSSSNHKDSSNKIDIVAGFDREFNSFQKILSKLGIFSPEKKTKRMLIRICNLGNYDSKRTGLPKYFDEKPDDNILGLIVDLTKKDKTHYRNLSYFLKEYFRKHQSEEHHIFLVLKLQNEKGKKIISNIFSQKDSSKDRLRAKIGKKLMKNELPKTWKMIDNKNKDIADLDFFYSSYLKIKKPHHKIKGFEPARFRSYTLSYPYEMYLDMLLFLKEKFQGTLSPQKIVDETMK